MQKFIAAEQARPHPAGSWQNDFLKRLSVYATGGKMIRGSLVCFSYEAFADLAPDLPVTNVALALELIHSGLLIHDDVMDHDDARRGQPSLHRQYQMLGNRQNLLSTKGFGNNMAICAGDMCLFMAWKLIADAPSAAGLFGDVLVKVCDGQMQDLYYGAKQSTPSKPAIYNLMRSKTAAYTLTLPLALGATLAGQSQTTVRKLRRFGDITGVIFQIRDDELGVMGNTAKTGKPVGADIREGKKTLIYYYLMKVSGAADRRQLREVFGDQNATAADIKAVQKLIRSRGVPKLLNEDIERFRKKALSILESIDLHEQRKDELRSLVDFCAQRLA
jgi:geranylgeranyl diphosphate synthase type I